MPNVERVVVVGASGFGREALDVLEAMRGAGADLEIVGVVDDGISELNHQRLADRGVAFLGTLDEWLATSTDDQKFVLGIGNPKVRRRLVEKLDSHGFEAFTAVHPTAVIGSRHNFGEGVVVCSGAVISTNVSLGRHVHVNPSVTIGHDTVVQEFASVNPAAVLSGEVLIDTEALVGASATVLQQLTVGRGTTVGAGALVTKNVPPNVVVKGVPGVWS